MEVNCKRCGYSWDYQGESEWYISCSRCKITINIRKIRDESRKKEKKKEMIESEIDEKKEYLTPVKKADIPTLNLSIVRGI